MFNKYMFISAALWTANAGKPCDDEPPCFFRWQFFNEDGPPPTRKNSDNPPAYCLRCKCKGYVLQDRPAKGFLALKHKIEGKVNFESLPDNIDTKATILSFAFYRHGVREMSTKSHYISQLVKGTLDSDTFIDASGVQVGGAGTEAVNGFYYQRSVDEVPRAFRNVMANVSENQVQAQAYRSYWVEQTANMAGRAWYEHDSNPNILFYTSSRWNFAALGEDRSGHPNLSTHYWDYLLNHSRSAMGSLPPVDGWAPLNFRDQTKPTVRHVNLS